MNPATPYLLWNVIRQCLVKDREDRIQRRVSSGPSCVRCATKSMAERYSSTRAHCRSLRRFGDLRCRFLWPPRHSLHCGCSGTRRPMRQRRHRTAVPKSARRGALSFSIRAWRHRAPRPGALARRTFLVYVAEQKTLPATDGSQRSHTDPGNRGSVRSLLFADGEWVGFFAGNQLKKVGLSGSLPVVLSEAPVAYGASWSSDGEIVSSIRDGRALVRIPDLGGPPKPFSISDVPLWPWVVPGGRAFLANNGVDIVAVSLDTGESTVLLKGGDAPRYLPTGQLVYEHEDNCSRHHSTPNGSSLPGPLFQYSMHSQRGVRWCPVHVLGRRYSGIRSRRSRR